MKPSLILLSGMYGSGKTTDAEKFRQTLGEQNCGVVDIDGIRDEEGNPIVDTRERWWLFPGAIEKSIRRYPFTVGVGSFHMRKSRDEFMKRFGDIANTYGFFYMLPMRETAGRLARRNGHEGFITPDTYRTRMRGFNNSLRIQNTSDLMLPTDPQDLSAEYRALLGLSSRNSIEESRQLPEHPWIIVTKELDPMLIAHIVREGITDPAIIRSTIEGVRSPYVESREFVSSGGIEKG